MKPVSRFSVHIFPPDIRPLFQVTATLANNGGPLSNSTWIVSRPFIYRSGSVYPPELLRSTPDQNYLSPGVRAAGLSLMAVALCMTVVAAIWVYSKREHQVVKKTQPFALLIICLGSFVTSWCIFPLSFDESYGWTQQQLDRGCISVVWLASIGHIITYGGTLLSALFLTYQ